MGYQEKKQPDVVFHVKQRTFFKHQFHAMHPVVAGRQWQAVVFYPAYTQHIKTHLRKCVAGFFNPLVGHQVVNYRNDGFFQDNNFKIVRK